MRVLCFFFSSRRRHTRSKRDWSSDVCSSDLMEIGHRGANHPVKDLETGKVEITSQNHGFCVIPDSLPATVEKTHEIGRASCRERVEIAGVAGALKKK